MSPKHYKQPSTGFVNKRFTLEVKNSKKGDLLSFIDKTQDTDAINKAKMYSTSC